MEVLGPRGRVFCRRLFRLPQQATQPSAPDVSPRMRDHVGAQVSSPGRKRSVQNSQDADESHLFQPLIRVSHAKQKSLENHRDRHAPGIGGKLLLKIPTKYNLFADAR